MENPLEPEETRALRRKARIAVLDALRAAGGEDTRRAVMERAKREGGFTQRELACPAPAKAQGQYERGVDHALSWTLTTLRRDGLVSNPRRSVWQLAGAAAAPEQPVAAPVARTRLEELRAMPYHLYLRSPEWRETRAAAFLRAEHCCALDASHTDRLEVHHRSYDRLGEERAVDLLVLCRECHELHHAENGRPGSRPERPPESFPPPFVATTTSPQCRPSLVHRLFRRAARSQ